MGKPIVLAYTGGLDAAATLHWLVGVKGNHVVTFTGDIGQKEDIDEIRQTALANGVESQDDVVIKDLKEQFVTDFIWPAIRTNAIYEGRYLLGGALPKPLLGRTHAEVAKERGIKNLAHGATSDQNDNIRYRKAYEIFYPDAEIYVPWEDSEFLCTFQTREVMLEYVKKKGLRSSTTKERPWTTENHLFHSSYEDDDLSDFAARRKANMLGIPTPQKAPNETRYVEIDFVEGSPKMVNYNDKTCTDPVEIMQILNELGEENAIGIIDIVETNLNGRKTRGIYVTPGGTILRKAHMELEGATMKGNDILERDSMVPEFSSMIYAGDWYSERMERMREQMDRYQKPVSGTVVLGLYKGNVMITGRTVQ